MKKHAGPIISAVLLLLPVLYIGSYFAIVVPSVQKYVTGRKKLRVGNSQTVTRRLYQYRCGGDWAERFFWPLEHIDRNVRPEAWVANHKVTSLDDLFFDVESLDPVDHYGIARNPGVATVERLLAGEPAIIHVLDFHYVDKVALGKAEGLEGDKLEAEYSKVLETAQAVRKSKLLILADVPEVFQEGLTDDNQETISAEILSLTAFHAQLRREGLEDADHERTLLRLNAAAELILDGKPIKLLPAEGAEHEAGKGDQLSEATTKARDAAIVNRIVKHGKTSWLVLGGGHDLTEAIKPTGWGYVRVTPKGYRREGGFLNDHRALQIEKFLEGSP